MTENLDRINQLCPPLAQRLERRRQEALHALNNPADTFGLRLRPGDPVTATYLGTEDADVDVILMRDRVLVRMVDNDRAGAVSLTNSAERAVLRVLQRLQERDMATITTDMLLRIFYRDSTGRWDEMVPSLRFAPGGRLLEPQIGFRAINGAEPEKEPVDEALAWLSA